jgi:hypothetical protein
VYVSKKTGYAYLLDNGQIMAVPLNYSSTLSGTPWSPFSAGVGNMRCGAVDDNQNLLFIGTDIGIGLMFTIGQWDQLQLFYSTHALLLHF